MTKIKDNKKLDEVFKNTCSEIIANTIVKELNEIVEELVPTRRVQSWNEDSESKDEELDERWTEMI